MVGYMKPSKKNFSESDNALYQSIYCGLCRCMKYEYGFIGMTVLNYELVNTLLLIGAMAQSPYPQTIMSCSLTPFYWRSMAGVDQEAFRAAAAVSITAAVMETQDDLRDNDKGKRSASLLHSLISPKTQKIPAAYKEELEHLEKQHLFFQSLESRAISGDPDVTFSMLTDACGEIFAQAACIVGFHAGCQQLKELYDLMFLWGQWIYLLDAVEDYAADKQKGTFNPLFLQDRPSSITAFLKEIEVHAVSVMEELPFRNYESIVHTLFRTQLPHRSNQIISTANLSEIEGSCHDQSIQLKN